MSLDRYTCALFGPSPQLAPEGLDHHRLCLEYDVGLLSNFIPMRFNDVPGTVATIQGHSHIRLAAVFGRLELGPVRYGSRKPHQSVHEI